MNLEQMKQRLEAIANELKAFKTKSELKNEDVDTINNLKSEWDELEGKIVAAEAVESIMAKSEVSTRQTVSRPSAGARVSVGDHNIAKDPTYGFRSLGHFAQSIMGYKKGTLDPKSQEFTNIVNLHQTSSMEDGGALIPEDFRMEIQKKVDGDESLLPKCMQLKTASNSVTLPINENAPWDSNGIQTYWTAEGASIQSSKESFGETQIKLHKLASLVKVTDEMMEDSVLLESFINAAAPESIMHKINSALISGDGVAKPQGFLNAGFKYQVAKEAGQAADTIVYQNIVKMEQHLLPASAGKAIWLAHPGIKSELRLMKFPGDNSPVYIPVGGLSGKAYETLMGKQIMYMMGAVKALGDEGDISLVDFSKYIALLKTTGIKKSISTHVYFEQDIQALKFTFRVGGHIPFKSPIASENDANFKASCFVTLQSR